MHASHPERVHVFLPCGAHQAFLLRHAEGTVMQDVLVTAGACLGVVTLAVGIWVYVQLRNSWGEPQERRPRHGMLQAANQLLRKTPTTRCTLFSASLRLLAADAQFARWLEEVEEEQQKDEAKRGEAPLPEHDTEIEESKLYYAARLTAHTTAVQLLRYGGNVSEATLQRSVLKTCQFVNRASRRVPQPTCNLLTWLAPWHLCRSRRCRPCWRSSC